MRGFFNASLRRSGHYRRNVSRTRAVRSAATFGVDVLESRVLLSAIASGQTITASISAKGEVDTYTINGVAGGTLLATVGETVAGSSLTPRIEIHAPNGTLLTANQSVSGVTITQNNLPSTGTYSVIVKDFNGTGT